MNFYKYLRIRRASKTTLILYNSMRNEVKIHMDLAHKKFMGIPPTLATPLFGQTPFFFSVSDRLGANSAFYYALISSVYLFIFFYFLNHQPSIDPFLALSTPPPTPHRSKTTLSVIIYPGLCEHNALWRVWKKWHGRLPCKSGTDRSVDRVSGDRQSHLRTIDGWRVDDSRNKKNKRYVKGRVCAQP